MKELSSYELCLLIYLCYGCGSYHTSVLCDEVLENYLEVWTKLQNFVNNYTKGSALSINQTTEYIKLNRTGVRLFIKVKDKQLLRKFLDDYSSCYEDDVLKSCNNDRLSSHELKKRFIKDIGNFKASVDKSKILKEYYVDDTKYISIILWGLCRGYIKLRKIRFSLAPIEERLEHMPYIDICKRKVKSNISDNIMDFGITVDLSEFIRLRGLRKAEQDAKKNPDTIELQLIELENPEWKIFTYIYRWAEKNGPEKNGIQQMRKIYFPDIFKFNSTFDKNRSNLNTKVRKIVGRPNETKRYLISPNKEDENIFNIDMDLYKDFCRISMKKFEDYI
ncbi:MAG: hypothetical protein MJ230_03285 [bacterium]|nr:hypothetical protein [bacterium]